ncbi:hypothetical protein IG518_01955, partial [Vibrio cholerae]|nr:hypothetical protein [Vibrio cholerae]
MVYFHAIHDGKSEGVSIRKYFSALLYLLGDGEMAVTDAIEKDGHADLAPLSSALAA